MIFKQSYPTKLHQDAAEIVRDYFSKIFHVDTILVVNSYARGQATPDTDLDFAALVSPDTTATQIKSIENSWQIYSNTNSTLLTYKQSNQFARLHLDVFDGNYLPAIMEIGGPLDYFEIEIRNQIAYSAHMTNAGPYFREL